jgi:mono/diheme cytochrome c family protein
MKRLRFMLATAVLAGFALSVATGCGSARRGEPVQAPLELTDAELVQGRDVFMRFCNSCHPGGESGLGFALNNKPLPGFLIRFQVRNGLGAMPAFGPDLISSEELDYLVAYLVTLRRHDA